MANIVTITKVNQGPANVILHVYIASDGAAGELVDEVLIDPVSIGLAANSRFAIEDIKYNFMGFGARIEFDTGLVDDKMIWVLGENNSHANFKDINGLYDRSALDGTGKVQLTTSGFTSAGDQGSMVICIRTTGVL